MSIIYLLLVGKLEMMQERPDYGQTCIICSLGLLDREQLLQPDEQTYRTIRALLFCLQGRGDNTFKCNP
jgi:hypothetical protein